MEFIECNHCLKRKNVDEFNWRWKHKGVRQSTCRECQHKQRKTWYKNNREEQIAKGYTRKLGRREAGRKYNMEYLSTHPCACGESDPMVLEFHHIRGNKKAEVTRLAQHGYSIETIRREIEKCIVVCANCHKRMTYKESWRV